MMGTLDLRSLGFYKIKQEVLQEHLGGHYHFKLAAMYVTNTRDL